MATLLDIGAESIVEFDPEDESESPAATPTRSCTFGSLARHATFVGPWAKMNADIMAKATLAGICEELTLRPSVKMAGSTRFGEEVICYRVEGAGPAAGQGREPAAGQGQGRAAELWVPRAYFHERFGRPGKDETSAGLAVAEAVGFEGTLRDDRQRAFVAKMVSTLVERRITIALGSAEPGCGKTVMFLYVWAVVLRRKCLVVVHGLPIVAQWVAAARRFCPAARIGIIHQDTWQLRDRDIVVASSDTVAARAEQFTEELWREFGVVCFDEAHHIMASTFVSIYQRCMHARYCISLTGTPYRKDGLTHAMPFLTGPNAASMKNTDPVHVRCVQFHCGLQTHIEFKFGPGKGKPNEAAMVSAMVEDERRTRLIAQVVRDAVLAGRKALVLCDRNDLREAIRILVVEMLGEAECPVRCRPWAKAGAATTKAQAREIFLRRRVMDIYDAIYIEPYRATPTPGEERRKWAEKLRQAKTKLGMTDDECLACIDPPSVVPELQAADEEVPAPWVEALNAGDDYLTRMNKQHARAILATYVMAREALDIPGLNTLVLATPSSDVRQAVGRIRRTGGVPASTPGTAPAGGPPRLLDVPQALVVDIVDTFPPFVNWAMTRQRYYDAERFRVTRANIHAPSDAWDTMAAPTPAPRATSSTSPAKRTRPPPSGERNGAAGQASLLSRHLVANRK
jgi:hypothetical protein